MGHRPDLDKLMDETRASQRNIVFPDTVRNGRAVDAFLWRGSPDPPLVQRIGAWMFGLAFIGFGLTFWAVAKEDRHGDGPIFSLVMGLIGLAMLLIGIRVFRNGFPRRIKPPENSN
jgi:hypothetical protein